jgi:regulator of sigma E protease
MPIGRSGDEVDMEIIFNLLGSVWSYIIQFVLVLTLVVFIHELGHFLVARWCGVTVKAFSIGFGPEIAGFYDRHGTRWRFAWIPLGGYVKFLDDDNPASMPSPEAMAKMSDAERKSAFHAKPVSQRAAVVAAGPIANFLLAIVLFTGLNAVYGVRVNPPTVDAVVPETPAARAGFLPGDTILEIDGSSIDSADDVQNHIDLAGAHEMAFLVDRNGDRITLKATPTVRQQQDPFGRAFNRGDLGIRSVIPARVGELQDGLPAQKAGLKPGDIVTAIDGTAVKAFEDIPQLLKNARSGVKISVDRAGQPMVFEIVPVVKSIKDEATGKMTERTIIGITRGSPDPKPVSLWKAATLGVHETYQTIASSLMGLKAIWSGRQSAEQMGGPILMAEVTAKVAELGFEPLLRWVGFISANIGFLNLLPIPVLDGGHLLFYGIEAVRRKPLSDRFQQVGFQVGLALILMLMIFVNFNDLTNLVRRFFG